jgi:hypothetical protein
VLHGVILVGYLFKQLQSTLLMIFESNSVMYFCSKAVQFLKRVDFYIFSSSLTKAELYQRQLYSVFHFHGDGNSDY